METDRPVSERSACRNRLPRGRASAIALAGVAIVAVFLVATIGSLWWGLRAQRNLSRTLNAQKVRALGRSLGKTTEALLSANEVSALRRIIAESGVEHNLDLLRIVLPDGRVIADADPTDIDLVEIPDAWSPVSPTCEESLVDGEIYLSIPLEVPGRGGASLQIAATTAPFEPALEDQAVAVILASLALIALLVIYRAVRPSLRAVGAIREAVLATAKGLKSTGALEISEEFGREAEAWNALLAEWEATKKQLALGQAKQSLQSRSGVSGEVGAACDGLPHGLVLVDTSGRVKYANGAAGVFLQANRDEMLGADLSRFVEDQKVLEAIQNAAAGPTYERAIVEVARDGSVGGGVLRFVIRPVRREDPGVAMIIIEDITQKRVAEEARTRFLAEAAHELRTPLTNIRLYVETALVEGENDPAIRAKSLNVINEESGRLERIVSDILSVSEIEAGSFKLRRDDVRVDALLEQIKTDYEPQAKEKQITLKLDLPPKLPVLQGDRDKIALALHNLVGNALKYTPEGGCVTVNAAVDKDKLTVDVNDTGIGISEADAERIFEKFYRAENARVANITGSGMGLAIAREVIRLHGGDIVVHSELNKGSNFTLTLPVLSEAA